MYVSKENLDIGVKNGKPIMKSPGSVFSAEEVEKIGEVQMASLIEKGYVMKEAEPVKAEPKAKAKA